MLFGACTDILEETPKSIATETFYKTDNEIAAAVNAAYFPIQSNSFNSYFTILNPLGEDIIGKGSLAAIHLYQGFSTTNISNMSGVWSQLYLSIRNANMVIKNVPNSSQISSTQKAQYIGEAKFIRALDYFNLVRLWGGVPLRTEETIDQIDIPRSSLDEVYTLVLSDLKYAEENLPDKPRLLGTASKWVAKTLLSDVYLTRKDWGNASTKAEEVISSGKYSLVKVSTPDDFEKIFGADVINTTEEIFYFKYNRQYGWSMMGFFHKDGDGYKPYGANYYSFYSYTTSFFYKNWDNNDFRKQHNYYKWDIGLGDNTLLFKKYIDPKSTDGTSPNDWPIYRYADVLLIYAEAANNVNNGPTVKAIECLNKVHRRAYGYDPEVISSVDFQISNYNKDSFSDLVLKEKGYETQLECKRWLDLIRTGKAAKVIKEAEGIDIKTSMFLWPIPITETNYNKAIDPVKDQNPGY